MDSPGRVPHGACRPVHSFTAAITAAPCGGGPGTRGQDFHTQPPLPGLPTSHQLLGHSDGLSSFFPAPRGRGEGQAPWGTEGLPLAAWPPRGEEAGLCGGGHGKAGAAELAASSPHFPPRGSPGP